MSQAASTLPDTSQTPDVVGQAKAAADATASGSTNYNSYISNYIGASAVAGYTAILLFNNVCQEAAGALASLIVSASNIEEQLSETEQQVLNNFRKTQIDDKYGDKKDPSESDLQKMSEANTQLQQMQTEWDTKVSQQQSEVQALTQKQQTVQGSTQQLTTAASSYIDLLSYAAQAIMQLG